MQPPLPEHLRKRHPIIAAFVRRPVTLTVLVLATLLVGVIAQSRINLEMMPQGLEVRGISVTVPVRARRSNYSPKEIEERITLVAEGELSTISGIESLLTVSTGNSARFEIAFRGDVDIGVAYDQVRDRMERAKAQFDIDVAAVRYRQWTYGSDSFASLNIIWDRSVENPFDKLGQKIIPALEATQGVSHVTANGDLVPYFRVALKRDAIATHPQVNLNRLLNALQSDNRAEPIGSVSADSQDTFIIADSRFRSLEDLKHFPVSENLSLADIAEVREAYNVRSYVYAYQYGDRPGTYDGGRSVWTQVYKTSTSNIVEAGQAFDQKLEELREDPTLKGFNYRVAKNQGIEIVEQLGTLFESLLIGGVLAVLSLLAFVKSLRLALVIALSIPLSMTLALVVMYFSGETLNLFSLMGFTVAGGMLLDNAIVVSENIYRRLPLDGQSLRASVSGAGEVGLALVLATSTTVAVLLSFVVFSDSLELSFFMTRIAYPIWFSLAFSVIVALLVVPHATSRLFSSGVSRSSSVIERTTRRFLTSKAWLARCAGHGLSTFFGRPDEVPAKAGLGEYIDGRMASARRRRIFFLGASVLGVALGVWVFYLAGGDMLSLETFGKKMAKLFGAGGKSERGEEEGEMLPVFLAVAVALATPLLPLIVAVFWPRQQDYGEQAPVLARLTRVYSNLLSKLEKRAVTVCVYIVVIVGGLVFFGQGLIKTTESNPSTEKRIRFTVRFSDPLDFESDLDGVGFEGQPQMPREWAYFLHMRHEVFGINEDGSVDAERQKKAIEEYGIERGAMSLSRNSIRLWLTLDTARVSEAEEIREKLTKAFPESPGFRMSGGYGGSSVSQLRVQLRGRDFSRLRDLGQEVIQTLEGIQGIDNVEEDFEGSSLEELILSLDRSKTAAMGVDANTLARVLGFQVNGTRIEDFVREDMVREISVVLDDPYGREGERRKASFDDVLQVAVPTEDEKTQVTVGALIEGRPTQRAGADEIRRLDRQTTLTITAQTEEPLYEMNRKLRETLEGLDLEPGYTAELGGGSGGRGGRRRVSLSGDSPMTIAGAAATTLVLAFVMGFLFESFVLPLIVILACVPGAVAGTYWMLLLTDTMFDQICYLGLIILIGVSVNNGIVLVDLINRLRWEGLPFSEALRQAGEQRIRPILMTSLTTIVGIVPMAIGSAEFIGRPYYPLGRAIIGGMAFSTVVTLFAIPFFYILAERAREFCRSTFLSAGKSTNKEGTP